VSVTASVLTLSGSGVSVEDLGIPAATRFPSDYYPRMPWYVKAWDGKVWLANGNCSNASPNANSGSGMVAYNPATNTSTNEYTNSDEQICTFRVINGQLWAGGGDKDGGGDNQWLYKYVSGSWSKYEVLPFAEHAYDLAQVGSDIWCAGGTIGYNMARSTDGGETWTGYTISGVSWAERVYNIDGTIWCSTNLIGTYNFSGGVYSNGLYPFYWDGSGFTRSNYNLAPGYTYDIQWMHSGELVNGQWVYILARLLNQRQLLPVAAFVANTSLTSTTELTFDGGEVPYDLKAYSGTGYLLTSKPDGSGGYISRIRTSTDATNWPVLFEFTTPSFALSFDILDGAYYIALGSDFGLFARGPTGSISTDTGRLYRVKIGGGFSEQVVGSWGNRTLKITDDAVVVKEVSGDTQMRLGAQTHVAQGWDPVSTLSLLKDANLRVARDEAYWDFIETSAGVYDFSSANFGHWRLNHNQAVPVDTIFTADFFNSLYDSGQTPYSSGAQTAFANYAAATVNNFKQIKAVEVWNEINGGTWTNGTFATDKPGYYKTLVQKVYTAVKAVRPEVTVIGGATVLIAAPFWQALSSAGALPYMDACSVHPYDAIETWEGRFTDLRNIIGNKPLWVTEFGGADMTPGWFCKAATILDSFDVHTAILYLLRSDGSFPGWGLYNSSGVPYAVRGAAKFMSSLLAIGNGRFRRQALLDNGLKAYQRGDTWILWGTGHPVAIKAGVIVRDATGDQIAAPATLGTNPIVLEGVRMGENVVISASPVITSFADDYGTADWSYYARATSGGALTALSQIDNGYYYYKGLPGTYLRIEPVAMHPESSYDAQARYTAPRTIGACTASFSFQVPDSNSNGIVATILKNGVSVWSQTVTPTSVVSATASLSLNSGDTVDIRVNNNGSTSFDATNVTFTLST